MSKHHNQIPEELGYAAGPYKGYYGRALYDDTAELFHGEVVGLRDVITFQARRVKDLKKAFADSVDDYLDFCAQSGQSPEKPLSGRFITRVSPDLHRKLANIAAASGQSLNQIVCDALQKITRKVDLVTMARPQSGAKRRPRPSS